MSPFEAGKAREIMVRDGRRCQNPNCIVERLYGVRGSYYENFNMHASHYPELHKPYVDSDISNGRAYDVACHLVEELMRGNTRGAKLMYSQHHMRTTQWRALNGLKDEKAPFEWYQDYADATLNGDESGIQGLVEAFQENYMKPNSARGQDSLFK